MTLAELHKLQQEQYERGSKLLDEIHDHRNDPDNPRRQYCASLERLWQHKPGEPEVIQDQIVINDGGSIGDALKRIRTWRKSNRNDTPDLREQYLAELPGLWRRQPNGGRP